MDETEPMKLSKVYEPALYETDIYSLWEQSGAFKPVDGIKTYSLVMPPPNANAPLHSGHALFVALEDIAARYHRMKGEKTLWLPGADHAGFETQVVYEKQLAKIGKSRFDLSREELYGQIYEFVVGNRQTFEDQFRALGASVDWSRFTFTLDQKIIDLAYKTFKNMWDEKLIYRGERLVNYCTFHRTGFADIEVVYRDSVTPLYYMKYGPFTVATTRPETKFGDTAVAVNPSDDRYKQWVGKVVTVEGVNGPFELQVIADEMVDPDFGTGVVKITPAHDFNDWEVSKRHNLPAKRVIDHDGTLNHEAGKFSGMTIMEARQAVVDAMKQKNLLLKVDTKYKNRVGHCYKCDTVIEPMLMDQWFVNMDPLSKPAIRALKDKKIKFYPDSKRLQLIKYLEGLRDWNISRQIAWGIPIPAFQNVDDSDDWIFDTRVGQEIIEIDGKTYHRDPDVFDTWFSSASWPYATMGFPENDDFKEFYPLNLMETGGEILYPWVSRMIMMGLYVTKKLPFEAVYIHGYVLASDGAKMSKSLGNVVNPMEAVKKYGSDALRMGIIAGRVPAVNRGYDNRKIEDARNFCNKLWNVARFIEDKLEGNFNLAEKPMPKTIADDWILTILQQSNREVSRLLDDYRYAEAYDHIYHLVWDDLADWYIEASKADMNPSVLSFALETILKLAHPFAPFLTETIWQTLTGEDDSSMLVSQPWPEIKNDKYDGYKVFEEIKAIVEEIRFISATVKYRQFNLYHSDDPFLLENGGLIKTLSKVASVESVKSGSGLHLTATNHNGWLDLDKNAATEFLSKLKLKHSEQEKAVERLKARLENTAYINNAPKSVIDETKQQLNQAEELLQKTVSEYDRFGSAI